MMSRVPVHPNVAPCLGGFEDDRTLFIVTERYEGIDLFDFVAEEATLFDPPQTMPYIIRLKQASFRKSNINIF